MLQDEQVRKAGVTTWITAGSLGQECNEAGPEQPLQMRQLNGLLSN